MSETENMDERMKAFTPGPWVVSSSVLVCTKQAKMIANCAPALGTALGVDMDECFANARLIAAAPDLLAFVAAIAGRGLTGDAYGIGREEDELTLNARALLLKATGTL